jgi:prevent-host-death family protein
MSQNLHESESTAAEVGPFLRLPTRANKMYISMYIKENGMAQRQSIAEARNNLPSLVREAESGKAVELTRRGKPVAMLIGRRQYEQLALGHRSFSEAYRTFRREFDLQDLDIDPSDLFGRVRDDTAGREVSL